MTDATARIHRGAGRRSRVAACGVGAAAGVAGGRIRQRGSPDCGVGLLAVFHKALGETGYVEGRNVTIECHLLEDQFDRLPALMADVVRSRVAVITTNGGAASIAAKTATATIPIVFGVGEDPVKLGLVASSPGQAATRQASIFSTGNWRPSSWDCSVSWCQGRSRCPAKQSGRCYTIYD
jgi:hypothetical protein